MSADPAEDRELRPDEAAERIETGRVPATKATPTPEAEERPGRHPGLGRMRAARDREGRIRPYTRQGFFYWVIMEFLGLIVRLYVRLEITGRENIPRQGGTLFLVNHGSYLDPPILATCVPRQMQYLARVEVIKWPFFGWIMRTFNTHPIKRGAIDRNAIALCRELLQNGWPLAIFPEGTRTEDGNVHLPKAGFAMILEGQPEPPLCVPVFIEGAHRAYGRGMKFPLPRKVRVHFGPPFKFAPQAPGEKRRTFYERCVTELADRWRSLGATVVQD